jgi:predicted permease
MTDFWLVSSRVAGVFLVMVAGAVGRKLNWLTSESDRSLAKLTANVLLPALFFHRIVTSSTFDSLTASWLPPLLGFGFTCLGFAVGAVVAWTIGPWIGLRNEAARRSFAFCAGIANYGYIPLPLAESFYPDAVVTLMVHNVGVDVAMWSVGVLVLSGAIKQEWKRALFSPPLIAVIAALFLRQTGWAESCPKPFLQLSESLGQAAIPLGLVLGGAIILDYLKLAQWRENVSAVIAAVVVRQLLLPILMLLFATLVSLEQSMAQVLLLQAAMPAATFPIVMVRLFQQDTETALRTVLGTSLLGIVTIPLWMSFGHQMLFP